jgi:hypothetical protein
MNISMYRFLIVHPSKEKDKNFVAQVFGKRALL